jgi:hypothetical protein
MPTLTEPNFDLRRGSIGSITSFGGLSKMVGTVSPIEEDAFSDVDDEQSKVTTSSPSKVFNNAVIMWTIALVLLSYHGMAFVSIIPIYVLDNPRNPGAGKLDLGGGLGMTVHDVGTYMAVNSVVALFSQGILFPLYIGYLGVWHSILSLTIFTPLVYIFAPFISLLGNPDPGIYLMMALQGFCSIVIYPSQLIMLKNATASQNLGMVNGLAMSACSAARTIAPPLVGIFYAGFGSAGAWWSCAFVSVVAIVQVWFTPRAKEEEKKIMRRASRVVYDEDEEGGYGGVDHNGRPRGTGIRTQSGESAVESLDGHHEP